jgi:hypothetical protein
MSNISRFVDDGLTVVALTNTEFDAPSEMPGSLVKEVAKFYFE